MSKQSSLDRYFKSKSSLSPSTVKSSSLPIITATMSEKNVKKRRSLSLIKPLTPEKTPKTNSPSVKIIEPETEVVNLCSDDENTAPVECKSKDRKSHNCSQSDDSNSSESTIKYNLTPTTPQKSPQTSSSNSFCSPNSQKKFYSPTKKRAVFKRTPVKKNLAEAYFRNSSQPKHNLVDDKDFIEACEDMDDKSIFLLTIINKFLKDQSLRELLDDRSIQVLSSCLHIKKPGIRLICRLFWRQHGWYRREKLVQITNDKKEAIGDPQFVEMLNCLIDNDLLTADTNTMTFDDLTKVLKSEEIKQICKDFRLKVQSKQDAETALRRYSQQSSIIKFYKQASSNNSDRVLGIMKSKAGTCYKLSELANSTLSKLYLLMYLGMNHEIIREKRLELLLINDKIKRETYPVDKDMVLDNASVVFKTRREFTKYWNAHLIYENYLTQTETSEKCNIVLKVYDLYKNIDEEDMMRYKAFPTWLRRFTAAYIYVKILESGVQELKKDKSQYELAVEILSTLISQIAFRQHKKAEWYAEKALVLHKLLAQHDEAAKVLLKGLKSDLPEEAKDAMRPRANKIANQQNIKLAPGLSEALIEYGSKQLILEKTFKADHVRKQHMEQTSKQRGKKKFEVHTEDGKKFLDAEDYCVLHYTTNGDYTHGEHREGRIIITIYFLLFWDIIYTKPRGVVGIFLSYYQMYPLDMYDGSFYTNRKTLIDDRLFNIENMSTDQLIEALKLKWDERPECEVSVRRDTPWESVSAVARCLGSSATAALCRRLATNYGHAHSGFPDLTLWNIHTKQIKFVEVKTDTDKPSMKQLQWMQYLRQHEIDTGFCYVGVDSTRCKARAGDSLVTVRSVNDINKSVKAYSP